MDAFVRTEEGTRGGEKGKVPIQCSPIMCKVSSVSPQTRGPLVMEETPGPHILLLQHSRLQEKPLPIHLADAC